MCIRDSFGHDRLSDQVGTGPSVLGGDAQRWQLEFHTGVERGSRIGRITIDGGGMRGDPGLGELAQGVPELLMGVGQGKEWRSHRFTLLTAGEQPKPESGRPLSVIAYAKTAGVATGP